MYAAKRNEILDGVPEKARTLIDLFQPRPGPDVSPEIHAIAILNRLSNDDKHLEQSMRAVADESERLLGRDLVGQEFEIL